jgi:hypothetical protein
MNSSAWFISKIHEKYVQNRKSNISVAADVQTRPLEMYNNKIEHRISNANPKMQIIKRAINPCEHPWSFSSEDHRLASCK